ncbi:hypothetical protein PIROE2DRAFT_65000 [Piromyces sp. E2]|nr:hypothetical protein PIROE2DRAFT_65000 [Piromyces sp. E2]|eukprot:OUM57457.1 hypothetical protein PIROE2DRAFT_65000 [Piromyces sp. E2]
MSAGSNAAPFSISDNGSSSHPTNPTNSNSDINTISEKNSEISSTTVGGDSINTSGGGDNIDKDKTTDHLPLPLNMNKEALAAAQNAPYNGWGELMFYRMNNPNMGNPPNPPPPPLPNTTNTGGNNGMNGNVNLNTNKNPNNAMLYSMMNGSKDMLISVSSNSK